MPRSGRVFGVECAIVSGNTGTMTAKNGHRGWIPGGLALWVGLITAAAPADDLLITELMAVNDGAIRDEDGDTPDFVEIFNGGVTPCELGGWYLSDDVLDLRKWRFPAVTLSPGSFLVVFCSDKDRRVPGRPLHANFKLSSLGEYLALVEPDGATVKHEFAPFPQQVPGFSYGLAQNSEVVQLIDSEAPARARVPQNGNEGTGWRQIDFNDASWTSGETGVGYDENATYRSLINLDVENDMNNRNTTCYVRVPFSAPAGSNITGFVLRMKYDDGFSAFVNGEPIASANAPSVASLRWNSEATGLHDDGDAVNFEEFSGTVPGGTVAAGATNVLAIHGLNDNPGSSDFVVMPELEGFSSGELDRDTVLFFPDPSPGAGNLPGVSGIALPPQISPTSRVLSSATSVIITTDSPGATIRYTTNGDLPTQGSTRYTGSIDVSTSMWLRARVFEDDGDVSQVVSANYIFLASSVRNVRSSIPVVVIDNYGRGRPSSGTFSGAFMAIYEPIDGRTSFSEDPTLAHRFGIKTRGSSTGGRDKVSYTFEFWDENNEDEALRPFGLPRESDWILYAAYNFDRAHLRNPLIYDLSRQLGRWAARSRFVEVYFNSGGGSLDSGDYRGIYSLMEKIKRDPARVDIEELLPGHDSEPEISGGYMLKIDRADPGDSGFSAAGRSLRHVEPKEDDIPSYQATWIRNYFNSFSSALNAANFRHDTLGYGPYVDEESWADHHMLNVLPKNVDALRLSTYFYKNRLGEIEFGPIWDFDRSMNSSDGRDDNPTTMNGTGDATRFFDYPWWERLFDDQDFLQIYRDRWHMFRTDSASNTGNGYYGDSSLPPLSNTNILRVIDQMAAEIRDAQRRDSSRWNQISVNGWNSEISRLKIWLRTRADWLDGQFRQPPTITPGSRQIFPGMEVAITGSGTKLYTTDGSDPRLPGGATSASAVQYTGPFTVTETTQVKVRRRYSTNDWTPMVRATYWNELPTIVVSEVMYHPEPDAPGGPYDDEDFEFVEFTNVGAEPVPLAGIEVSGGISFTFPSAGDPTLDPGEYVVIVNNIEAFAERYDVGRIFVAGEFDGRLENLGERIVVRGSLEEPIHDFLYDDEWYPTTDGGGDSLVIVDLLAERVTWTTPDNWGPSSILGGSPGASDEGFPGLGGRQRSGDSNQDGRLDVSDAFSLVRRLFLPDAPELPCDGADLEDGGNRAVFDVDADGSVAITDVIYLLDYLFQGGPAPPSGDCVRVDGCANVCRS